MRFASNAGEPTFTKTITIFDKRPTCGVRHTPIKMEQSTSPTEPNRKKRSYNSTLDDMPDYMILRFARHSASFFDNKHKNKFQEW